MWRLTVRGRPAAAPALAPSFASAVLAAAMVVVGIGTLFFATSADAEETRVFRVAVLVQVAEPRPGEPRPITRAFEQLGYVEGRNIVFDRRFAAGDNSRLRALAADVVALKPDVIIVETTVGTLAAKAATSTIPIVFYNVTDPMGTGIVASMTRPGGNVTGIADAGSETAEKGLEMLHELVPGASRAAVLMSDSPVHEVQLRELRKSATAMGMVLVPVVATRLDELDLAFASVRSTNAMVILGGPPFSSGNDAAYRRLAEFQQKARLPIVCADMLCIRAGGLVAYWPLAPWKAAVAYADKILKGTPPGDLPVQLPEKFDVVLNAKVARELRLVVPPALRLRATQVIE